MRRGRFPDRPPVSSGRFSAPLQLLLLASQYIADAACSGTVKVRDRRKHALIVAIKSHLYCALLCLHCRYCCAAARPNPARASIPPLSSVAASGSLTWRTHWHLTERRRRCCRRQSRDDASVRRLVEGRGNAQPTSLASSTAASSCSVLAATRSCRHSAKVAQCPRPLM
jgi:hypothetical protein